MKKLLYIAIFLLILSGCKKDHQDDNNNNNNNNNGNKGSMMLHMSYHSSGNKSFPVFSPGKTGADTLYTQFGDYITSITPTAFIGKFLDMRLQNWDAGDTTWNYSFNIIDNNTPIDSSNRLADFTSNATVPFGLDPNVIPDGANFNFNIFVFITLFYYQEFELPAPYTSVPFLPYLEFGNNNILNNFDDTYIGGNRTGLTIKGGSDPFLAPIFDSAWTGFNGSYPPIPKCFTFGSYDSTWLYFSNVQHIQSITNPLGQYGYNICSNAYNPITLAAPSGGDTVTVSGSLTFNTSHLIQVYAGADNVPYTSDDVFVYAPNFWERLAVILTVGE